MLKVTQKEAYLSSKYFDQRIRWKIIGDLDFRFTYIRPFWFSVAGEKYALISCDLLELHIRGLVGNDLYWCNILIRNGKFVNSIDTTVVEDPVTYFVKADTDKHKRHDPYNCSNIYHIAYELWNLPGSKVVWCNIVNKKALAFINSILMFKLIKNN